LECAIALQDRTPGVLQGDVVIRVQVVEADNLVTTIEQRFRRMKADEAGGAGDQDLQAVSSLGFGCPSRRRGAPIAVGELNLYRRSSDSPLAKTCLIS